MILYHLNPHLTRQDTAMHDCIPPQKVLAIGLHRLDSIGPTFNVGKSTVIKAVQDVVNALLDASDQFIEFSTTPAGTAASTEHFRAHTRSELVHVAGAIDGTHIKIVAPRENALDYFSRYQQHDFIIQAVVEGRGKFIDAVCGFPENCTITQKEEIYYKLLL